jgi:hypothetical protein
MLKQNIDFFAVSAIALAMLGFAEIKSWHFADGLDSIRIEKAIHIESCPISRQTLANLFRILN